MSGWRRLVLALVALVLVMVAGTVGYLLLGFTLLDAAYQTITTVTTVGFREVKPLGTAGKIFTMVLILVGVGTTLYALGVLLETLIEGHLQELVGRRRMQRRIAGLRGHVIICGWGRVGRALAAQLAVADADVVVVDINPERLQGIPHLYVVGDATADATLEAAGIAHARSLVATLETDSASLFVTLSARSLRPDLFIVARARVDSNEEKFTRAGADRVVNPQQLGGARMAAFVLQPNVAEFLDVVMHDEGVEFRLEEMAVAPGSPLVGCPLRELYRDARSEARVLALREGDRFVTNPSPDIELSDGHVLIVIGTNEELAALREGLGIRPIGAAHRGGER